MDPGGIRTREIRERILQTTPYEDKGTRHFIDDRGPIWLKGASMAAKRTILHPTDFSANSSQAFDVAVELARNRGAKLVVMHVAPRPLTTLGGAEAIPPSSDELALGEAKATLAKFRPVEGVQLETKLEVGEAAPSIVRFARDAGCELIVMGTH